jgi:hypothetical protein
MKNDKMNVCKTDKIVDARYLFSRVYSFDFLENSFSFIFHRLQSRSQIFILLYSLLVSLILLFLILVSWGYRTGDSLSGHALALSE